ncbi:MAG: N-acyl homoserine lactonase family protein [Bacteroidetes bacterium]|nr:N-acyl homoserine lactonase family protein [Bacteroidota bacterium]
MMFAPITVQLYCDNYPVKVHLISTGAVAVKTKFRENRHQGIRAMLSFLFDKNFTDWMPVYVLIIEHREGIFIFDAGEITAVNDKDYFKSSGFIANWFDTTQFKFSITKEEELIEQLHHLNISKEKVAAIVLTHLHFDHTDGIRYFGDTKIIVNKDEWERPFGDLPKLYPAWFKPVQVDFDQQYDVFEKAYCLTESKDIILVETPGHTYHHSSVVIKTDETTLFFAADICYSQQQLNENKFPGNNTDNRVAQNTYNTVKKFAQKNKLVFIPSHDATARERLQQLFALY